MKASILTLSGTISTPSVPIIGHVNHSFSHAYTIPAETVTFPLYFGATAKLSEGAAELDIELDEAGVKLFDLPLKLGGTVAFDKTIDNWRFRGSATLVSA